MKTCTKIIGGAFFALIVAAIVVLLAWPEMAATWHSYFDINNGRLRVEYVSFGRIYREAVKETEYSKLLKEFGFEELPADWRPANSRELGLRQLLSPQRVHHRYARLPSAATMFALWLQLQEKASEQEKREHLSQFRTLVREGTPEQVHEYVIGLLRTAPR